MSNRRKGRYLPPDHGDGESSDVGMQVGWSPSFPPTPCPTGHSHPLPVGLPLPPTSPPFSAVNQAAWIARAPGGSQADVTPPGTTDPQPGLGPRRGGAPPRVFQQSPRVPLVRTSGLKCPAPVRLRLPATGGSSLPGWKTPEAPEDHNRLTLPSVCSSPPLHPPLRSSSPSVATAPDLGHGPPPAAVLSHCPEHFVTPPSEWGISPGLTFPGVNCSEQQQV